MVVLKNWGAEHLRQRPHACLPCARPPPLRRRHLHRPAGLPCAHQPARLPPPARLHQRPHARLPGPICLPACYRRPPSSDAKMDAPPPPSPARSPASPTPSVCPPAAVDSSASAEGKTHALPVCSPRSACPQGGRWAAAAAGRWRASAEMRWWRCVEVEGKKEKERKKVD